MQKFPPRWLQYVRLWSRQKIFCLYIKVVFMRNIVQWSIHKNVFCVHIQPFVSINYYVFKPTKNTFTFSQKFIRRIKKKKINTINIFPATSHCLSVVISDRFQIDLNFKVDFMMKFGIQFIILLMVFIYASGIICAIDNGSSVIYSDSIVLQSPVLWVFRKKN